jgi:hypothetical protein
MVILPGLPDATPLKGCRGIPKSEVAASLRLAARFRVDRHAPAARALGGQRNVSTPLKPPGPRPKGG